VKTENIRPSERFAESGGAVAELTEPFSPQHEIRPVRVWTQVLDSPTTSADKLLRAFLTAPPGG
jgi:hypothetical protein